MILFFVSLLSTFSKFYKVQSLLKINFHLFLIFIYKA